MEYNKDYFVFEETLERDKFLIKPRFDLLPLKHTTGSFTVLPARLLGLNFADYLRMCRDIMGAEVIGKGTKYPVVYFPKNKTTRQFIKLLNGRAAVALFEREHRKKELIKKIEDLKREVEK